LHPGYEILAVLLAALPAAVMIPVKVRCVLSDCDGQLFRRLKILCFGQVPA
jgi:hypothetical protein